MPRNNRLVPLELLAAALAACLAVPARAAVTEPNGVQVPLAPPAGGTSLQAFFTAQGETIDAVVEAAAEPGAFSPLCDFTATLVLKESDATAGIAWYNTTAGAMGPVPAADVYVITPAATLNQTISSADIRANANYQGGLIGFGLYRDGGIAYWSEFRHNQFCTNCTGPGMMPDYWKAMLVYPSTQLENTFYLAFEDWPGAGADPNTWFNDGDFNDQVFRVTGVACPGSGAPCDTGLPGVCQPGLTECVAGGTLECRGQVGSTSESCDGLDNDCDGDVDNGDLCPGDEICERGRCVAPCSEVNLTCKSSEVCTPEGYCVDATCADVTCPPGQRCYDGVCESPCEGVSCPAPLVCLAGVCGDPCVDLECPTGRVCDRGVCVPECGCQICAAGLSCAPDGRCVPMGCTGVTCPAGETCSAGGTCVDACTGARCPRGEKCEMGACVDACSGVECPAGQKCLGGVCADSCTGVLCRPGERCVPGDDNQGECVPGCACETDCAGLTCALPGDVCLQGMCVSPCTGVTCAMTEVCRDGVCVDKCQGVTCGAGLMCENGICVSTDPPPGGSGGIAGASGSAGFGATGGTVSGGSGGGAGLGATGGAPNGGMGGPSGSGGVPATDPGCACRVSQRANSLSALAALALCAVAVARRRFRRAA